MRKNYNPSFSTLTHASCSHVIFFLTIFSLQFFFGQMQTGLFQVRELKQGGPAERCGSVLVGDTLVAVDSRSTKVLRHTKSLNMYVCLYICRCVSIYR
jgi:hypothetical protein